METYTLHLSPESDLKKSIEVFAKENKATGFVLGIVGDLSKASIQCPKQNQITSITGGLEIITLNGSFNPSKVHLHLSFSDSNCNVLGGHLENETTILKGADILLGLLSKKANNLLVQEPLFNNTENTAQEVAILNNCPWSKQIIRILIEKNIPHKVIEINNDEKFENIKQLSKSSTFPQIFYQKEYIGGYDEFLKFLDKQGL